MQVTFKPKLNSKYAQYSKLKEISVRENKIISKDEKIVCVGSCFAEEIRKFLVQNKIKVLPDFSKIKFDSKITQIDELPHRQHMNFYNPVNIRNELLIANGKFSYEEDDIFINNQNQQITYWDPYRRLVGSKTLAGLLDARQQIETVFKSAFEEGNTFVITLGLNEVIKRKSNSNVLSTYPAYGGLEERTDCYMHYLSFQEVCDEINEIISLIREISKQQDVKIVFTVSPVPLDRTFCNDTDVFARNIHAKSNLLTALHQTIPMHQGVYYFESYEIVSLLGDKAFKEDLRHVTSDAVNLIAATFLRKFMIDYNLQ